MTSKLIKSFVIALFSHSVSVTAVADPEFNPNENALSGQINHFTKCFAVLLKLLDNGQTGSETGSNKDPKTAIPGDLDSVTNCDFFWLSLGNIGPQE